MKKIDQTVVKETIYVAVWVLVLSALMVAVFLLLGKWDLSVLWGSLYGSFVAILNFFLLGIGVQIAVSKSDPADAKKVIRTSHSLRFLLLLVLVVVGIVVPWFHSVASVVPLLFPRIGLFFRPRFGGMDQEGGV